MMKLGSKWDVRQKIKQKKRPPTEELRDPDERMRKKSREVLGSVAKSATRMQLDLDKSSTSEPNPASTSNVAKLAMDDTPPTANTATNQEPQPAGADLSEASATLQNMTDMLSNLKNETNMKKCSQTQPRCKHGKKLLPPRMNNEMQ